MDLATTGSNPQVIDITPYLKKKKKAKASSSHQIDTHIEGEIADALVRIMILLDGLGHFKYSDEISRIIEMMFDDKDFFPYIEEE
jgi:hypothetical protein